MSRFGIRSKLKKLAGVDRAREADTCTVTYVLPDGSERLIETERHYSLLMAADAHGITISTGRRAGGTCPDGLCALCRVEILDATGLSEMNDAERRALDDAIAGKPHEGRDRKPMKGVTPTTRLGCHAKIRESGARVKILELFDFDSIEGTDPEELEG